MERLLREARQQGQPSETCFEHKETVDPETGRTITIDFVSTVFLPGGRPD